MKGLKIRKRESGICKSKNDRKHNGQKKKDKTPIYKTLHRKLKIEQPVVNSGAPEG